MRITRLGLLIGLACLLRAAPVQAAPEPQIAGLSGDGRLLLLGNDDGGLAIRDIDRRTEIAKSTSEIRRWRAIAASPDGKRLAALGDDAGGQLRLLLWEIGAALWTYDAPFVVNYYDTLGTPLFAPDGRTLLIGSNDQHYLIEFAGGRTLAAVGAYGDAPYAPTGRTLVTKSSDGRGFTLYDAVDGKAVASRDPPSGGVAQVIIRRDGRIAVIDHDCGITLFDAVDVAGSQPVSLVAREPGCDPKQLSPDGQLLSVELSPASQNEPGRHQVRDLETGRPIVTRPVASSWDSITISGGRLVRERGDRLFVATPPDGPESTLPLSKANFLNGYRSRSLSGSRLLSAFPGEPVMVFDIVSGARLICVERAHSCAARTFRSAYEMAVKDGAPARVVAALRGGEANRALLGELWGPSRLELARAQLALGNRAQARAAYEAALAEDRPETRTDARLGLARVLIEERELTRALTVTETAIAGLESDGALPSATRVVLLRKDGGLKIELSPIDLPVLAGLLEKLRSRPDTAAGGPLFLDEADYSLLNDLQEMGSSREELAAMGVRGSDSPAWSYARKKLFVRLGEAEALRAEIILAQSRDEPTAARAVAAQAALDRFAIAYDAVGSSLPVLSTELRAWRQTLRADALERMRSLDAALGARVAALNILRKEAIARPLALAEAHRRLATTQMALKAWPEARVTLEKARDLLAAAVPDNELNLLEVRGAIGLLLARHEDEAGQGLAAIEPAITLARRQIAVSAGAAASDRALRLRALFGAGVEARWLTAMGTGGEEKRADAPYEPGPPIEIGFATRAVPHWLRFSEDGTHLASEDFGRKILWETESGKSISTRNLSGNTQHFDTKQPLVFPDEQRTGRFENDGLTIEGAEGQAPIKLDFGGVVSVGAVSPDGKRVALGGAFTPVVRVYDSTTGTMISQLDGHSDRIYSLAWHPDSTRLATGARSGAIFIFDVESRLVTTRMGEARGIDAHRSQVVDIVFSADSRFLFSAAREIGRGSLPVRQWDVRSRRAVSQFDADGPERLLVPPDASRIAAFGMSGLQIYDTARPSEPKVVNLGLSIVIDDALIDPNSAIMLGILDYGARAVSLTEGKLLWSNAAVKGQSIAVSPAGTRIAIADPSFNTITILDSRDGAQICRIVYNAGSYGEEGDGGTFNYDKLAFTPDGTSLSGVGRRFAAEPDEAAFAPLITHSARWNAQSCAIEAELVGDPARQDVATQTLVFGGDAFALATRLGSADDPIVRVGFAAGGRRAFAVSRARKLWLAWPDGSHPPIELARFAPKVGKLLFSPDGKRLVVASESNIWMWNAENGAPLGRFGG